MRQHASFLHFFLLFFQTILPRKILAKNFQCLLGSPRMSQAILTPGAWAEIFTTALDKNPES